MAKIKIKLDSGAEMPTRATKGSVGYDVKSIALVSVDLDGNKTRIYDKEHLLWFMESLKPTHHFEVHTGVHVQPEEGYRVDLCPNSRIAPLDVIYGNGIGHIDPDFTGGIRAILNRVGGWVLEDIEQFLPGNVIGQLIILPKIDAEWELTDKLDETERGDGGFGSTAK